MPSINRLLLSVLLIASVPCRAEDSITIGMVASLSGDAAYWGANFRKGAELAIRDVNRAAGVAGRPLALAVEDDRCEAKEGLTAFEKLVRHSKISIVLGPVCSSPAAAVAPVARRSKVLTIVCAESADVATSEYVLRLWVPNDRQGARLARHALTLGKRAAVVAVENAYGEALSRAFVDEFTRGGGVISANESYKRSDTDMRAQVLQIKKGGPDVILLAGYIADGINLVRQLAAAKVSAQLLGSSSLNSPDFFGPLGPLAEGFVFADLADDTKPEFRERWQREFGEPWPGMQSTAGMGYDAVRLVARALAEHGGDAARAAETMRRMPEYDGVSGPILFDGKGNLVRPHHIYRYADGNAALVMQ